MPKVYPPNISLQVFKDLIPFSAVIIILYALDLVIRNSFKSNVAEGILKLFEPLFYSSRWMDRCRANYLGAFALFWFVGIHGPSIVEPAIAAIKMMRISKELQVVVW